MNNEDMSEVIQKLSSMLNNSMNQNTETNQGNNQDVSSNPTEFNEDTIKNILNNLNFNNESTTDNSNTENNGFNFDMNTLLKMRNVMDKMNSKKNDPRMNLLLSLKPYLNNNRKEKLNQYMQFLNISKVIEAFQSDNEDKTE